MFGKNGVEKKNACLRILKIIKKEPKTNPDDSSTKVGIRKRMRRDRQTNKKKKDLVKTRQCINTAEKLRRRA